MEASGAGSGAGPGHRGRLTVSAKTLGSELEEEGQESERRHGSALGLVLPRDCPPLTPTCMRPESMGAVVLTMWTLGVDVERMRWRGTLAGAGKGKCSGSQRWVQELAGGKL